MSSSESPARDRRDMARDLLRGFVEDTGVTSARPPRRYLWTDTFAACTCLVLDDGPESGAKGAGEWLETALRLVEQVHHVLGRHRGDDPRTGWISGLAEDEGERHPTAGGLRIGKKLPEREAGEPADPRREWGRDGQYYHYLTRWMHALMRVGDVAGRGAFLRWARELAAAAHEGFTHVEQPADTAAGSPDEDALALGTRLHELERFLPLADAVEAFWLDPAHRAASAWTEHRDINTVMLATTLVPEGYLGPAPAAGRAS